MYRQALSVKGIKLRQKDIVLFPQCLVSLQRSRPRVIARVFSSLPRAQLKSRREQAITYSSGWLQFLIVIAKGVGFID